MKMYDELIQLASEQKVEIVPGLQKSKEQLRNVWLLNH